MAFISSGNCKLDESLQNWLSWTAVETENHQIVANLIKERQFETLEKMMLFRQNFGTAGIRAPMAPGFSNLNDLVIIQISQGLASYVSSLEEKDSSVVIGFDGRHSSKKWAELTKNTFSHYGFKVYLFSKETPTPFVSFAVRHYGATVGVMITASHNPKEDNGYKVYWKQGAQIIPPHDVGIQRSILEHCTPEWSLSSTYDSFIDPHKEITELYCSTIKNNLCLDINMNTHSDVKIVYTPLHGVGAYYIDYLFTTCGFKKPFHVESQKDIDPDFSTVKFPNPEEGKSALELSIKSADKVGASYILANDPDADRLGIAQQQLDGTWKIFTGNEIAALLGWFQLYIHRKKFPRAHTSNHLYFISSTVSSKILQTIAIAEGLSFAETLTGFKWMANKALELETKDKATVLLAFEESIGFMCGTHVLDKDGIFAALRVAELLAYLKDHEKGITLLEKLNNIYKEYGYHSNVNSYYFIQEKTVVKDIFHRIRNYEGNDKYPTSILNGKYKIKSIRDLTTGYDSSQPNGKATLPCSSSSQMITFVFTNGFSATLRTSGTEPKLKYYAEYIGKDKLESDWKAVEEKCALMLEGFLKEFLQPQKNHLKHQSDEN